MAAGHHQYVNVSPSYHELRQFVIPGACEKGKELGRGAFGTVDEYIANGVSCAGKQIYDVLVKTAGDIAHRYVEECTLMTKLRHPNVVQFLGVFFPPESALPVLLMERLTTDLDSLLENTPNIPLSLRLSFLTDAARGLAYLHGHRPPIIHRDLSARNILLNSSLVAKISDLGNSRIVNLSLEEVARLSKTPGCPVYMPPEMSESNPRYGPSLDVFSLGHMGLFTAIQVFPGDLLSHTYSDPTNPRCLIARSEVERRERYFTLLHQKRGENNDLVRLIKECLDNDPRQRPTAEQLVSRLEEMILTAQNLQDHATKLQLIGQLKQIEVLEWRQALDSMNSFKEQLQKENTRLGRSEKFALTREKMVIHCQLEERERENATLQSQLRAKRREVKEREREIDTLQSQLRAKEREVEERERENATLQSQLRAKVTEADERERENDTFSGETISPQLQRRKVHSVGAFKHGMKGLKGFIKSVGRKKSRSNSQDVEPVAGGSIEDEEAESKDDDVFGLPIEEEEWFFGEIDRELAEVKCVNNGDFLVRYSSRKKKYILTCNCMGERKHFVILEHTDKMGLSTFQLESKAFPTLHELLKNYVQHSIPVTHSTHAIIKSPVTRYDRWSLRYSDVQRGKIIGTGDFSDVHEGTLSKTGEKVAVKVCRSDSVQDVHEFLKNAEILKHYDHSNIVKLIGVCTEECPMYCVLELMPGGNFRDYLQGKGIHQTNKKLCTMAIDVAKGMEYLGSKNHIHRDLAARNCLVGDSDVIKISGFGKSQEEKDGVYAISSGMKSIPIRWTAPEALNYSRFTSNSDVWSFGVLLWETFSLGTSPYPGMRSNHEAREKIEMGYRMPPPTDCPQVIYDIMLQCWKYDPKERPTFEHMVIMLQEARDQID